jgi:serine/threonine protein kinase
MSDLIDKSLGRYRILEQLGEGGMATVFKARDTTLERDVAVKIIRTDQFPPAVLEQVLKRFEREAKALARLTHPNIVHINDFGQQDGIPYLVMDYLPGGTLKNRLGKPMDWQEAVKLLLPVAEALDYAHSQGIIHRDLKPANVLLTVRGQPMLTDFGIAKILDVQDGQTLTTTGMGIGTPEYMSPEQGMGKPVDARTDVYSLGVLFYELVSGRKPYTADTPAGVLIKQTSDPLPSPTQFVPGLPGSVVQLLEKALAKSPEDRFPSMAEMASAMRGLLSGVTIVSAKPVELGQMDDRTVLARPGAVLQGAPVVSTVPQQTPVPMTQTAPLQSPASGKKRGCVPWIIGAGVAGIVIVGVVAVILVVAWLSGAFQGGSPLAPPPTQTTIPTSFPTQAPTLKPTDISLPTSVQLPTQPPEPTAAPAADFFTESFTGDLSLWPYYVVLGDPSQFTETQTSNGLRVELDDPDLYVYYLYDPYNYYDVRLDLTYTNKAHNSNNINIVCRSSDEGRYEFTVQNDGLYQIWVYDELGGGNFILLADGGSTAIYSGQQENEVTATCVGYTLSLYINGTLARSVTDSHYMYDKGQVGFGVNISPTNPVTPVIVDINSLAISQP